MKIPETSANVGAYYGNEENGQWQTSQQYVVLAPNGALVDGGVGGGVVGSGDGPPRLPLYPAHIPRQHMPGYVMAGGYYGGGPYPAPQPTPDDFADYMWMENEEEFDKQVMQQLEEEALMEQCIEAMLEDEQRERLRPNGHHQPTTSRSSSCGPAVSVQQCVSRSTLNPLAKEFVPTRASTNGPDTSAVTTDCNADDSTRNDTATTEDKPEAPPEPETGHEDQEESSQETQPERTQVTEHTESKTEEPAQEHPEVSAADIEPETDRSRDNKSKKVDAKRAKSKPQPQPQPTKEVKSDTKVTRRKETVKDVKVVKSETDANEKIDEAVVFAVEVKPPQTVEEPSGPKPINYAAAAKANKKKPSPPPALPPATLPPPADKPPLKPLNQVQEKKPAQKEKRKSSAK